LAKELGVASKDIIAKCNAEGIEPAMKNHMAAVTLGLAESIREWFSAGADVTTVEVAKPVDLSKVKKPRARKAKREEMEEDSGGVAVAEAESDIEVSETTSETAEIIKPTAKEAPPVEEGAVIVADSDATVDVAGETEVAPEESAVKEIAATSAAEVGSPAAETAESESVETVESADAVEVETPSEPEAPEAPPEPVAPAGPQLVPKPAELKGPRVVRIEAPEPVRTPRARPGPRPGHRSTTPDIPGVDFPPQQGDRGRRAGGGRGSGSAQTRSPRRRGSSDDRGAERLKEWRDQDLIERKERLASATGHGVKARRSAERKTDRAHGQGLQDNRHARGRARRTGGARVWRYAEAQACFDGSGKTGTSRRRA
jgi:hypothetical protein